MQACTMRGFWSPVVPVKLDPRMEEGAQVWGQRAIDVIAVPVDIPPAQIIG